MNNRLTQTIATTNNLIGPTYTKNLILVLSHQQQNTPYLLLKLSTLILISILLFIQNKFKILFISLTTLLFNMITHKSPTKTTPFLIQLIKIQLYLTIFKNLNYIFNNKTIINNKQHLSNNTIITQTLILPY